MWQSIGWSCNLTSPNLTHLRVTLVGWCPPVLVPQQETEPWLQERSRACWQENRDSEKSLSHRGCQGAQLMGAASICGKWRSVSSPVDIILCLKTMDWGMGHILSLSDEEPRRAERSGVKIRANLKLHPVEIPWRRKWKSHCQRSLEGYSSKVTELSTTEQLITHIDALQCCVNFSRALFILNYGSILWSFWGSEEDEGKEMKRNLSRWLRRYFLLLTSFGFPGLNLSLYSCSRLEINWRRY